MTKTALVTGLTGQDGSYLAELLLDKGYAVHGLVRRTSTPNTSRIQHIEGLTLHTGDMTDASSLCRILEAVKPDEIYNLAAMSDVGVSYKVPSATLETNGLGFSRLLEAARQHVPEARIYQASTSEMFGRVVETPQNERTPFRPRSPYGCSKVYAYFLGRSYREAYGMHVCNGILFNHESPRRGEQFVSRKIAKAAACIKLGMQDKLLLGNLDAKRDWGYAKEYVEWIWRIVQHDEPDDFVIASGQTNTVREFVSQAFRAVGLDWHNHVEIDETLKRPAEVDLLLGDATKARETLGFEPKTTFTQLVKLMVDAEMEALCGYTRMNAAS